MDTLRITATANGLNYLPEYLAEETGLFADAGLTVIAEAKNPWTGVLDDLDSGAGDLALGGLWVPGMYAGSPRELTVVCQLNHQFPMTIVLREAADTFDLSQLKGLTLLAPGAGGSAPYAFTAGLIRESGADSQDVQFIRDFSTDMCLELYRAGTGDGIIVDLVTATVLQAAGEGTIVFRHLDSGGIMPNSVYYCRTDRVEELRDRVARFVSCISAAMANMSSADEAIASVLAQRWPGIDQQLLHSVQAELAASKVWQTVAIDPAATERWMNILAEEGMVKTAPSYDQLVDESFMESYR